MICDECDKLTGDYKADKSICGSCREVLKIDLVLEIRGKGGCKHGRIYLSESNRNKKGRKKVLTATEQNDIYWAHERDGGSVPRTV